MKNSRRPLPKRLILSFALSLAAALLLAASAFQQLHGQSKELTQEGDTVLEKGRDFDPPVEITLVKSRAGVIQPGKKFSADEDWFKGLAVTVRNDSEQPITHLSLKLLFPRPRGQERQLDFVEPLTYGESPIPHADGQLPASPVQALMPGQSVELQLADESYESLRAVLRESKFPRNIKRIKIDVSMIGFSDGTIWKAGKRYELDKEQPGHLIPLEKKKGRPEASGQAHPGQRPCTK